MAKGVTKKKNRKLRRQIRKTVGALLMVSAIVVAAIPVPDVSANPTDTSEKVIKVAIVSDHPTTGNETDKIENKNYKNSVPYALDRNDVTNGKKLEQIVYTSGNGLFQFVYIRPTTTNPNKVAMILGYNGSVLADSSLTIPDQLEAFKKYSDNVTSDGYCLVSKLDEFLYYQVQEQLKNDAGYLLYDVINYENPDTGVIEPKRIAQNEAYKKDGTDVYVYRVKTGEDADNKPIYKEYELDPVTGPVYYPCYYDNQRPADDQIWSQIKDEKLYYRDGTNADGTHKYVAAGDDTNHWKIKADVAYIGAETIKDDGNGGWVLDTYITSPEQGIFNGNTNITNLNIGSNMRGISDFAFYNCGTLKDITLANGLTTIGNGAFAECRNLQTFKIESNALIEAIGKDAFYNCRSLKEFTVPIGVKALGDNCFEECAGLEKINFLGDGSSQMYLQTLGNHLFKNCSSLAEVEFPETYVENNLDIDMFKGCTSLQRVIIHNDKINFDDWHSEDTAGNYPNCTGNTWDKFKEEVPDSFYFEGPENSAIRDTAHNNSVTYKYPNQELYEKVEQTHAYGDTDANSKNARVIYRINNTGDLVYFGKLQGSNEDPDILEIPEKVGAFSIQRIAEGSFNNNCYLNKVTIPASVTQIGNNAFRGCHNLKTVIYTDASTITSIGTDAFKTHDTVCGNKCTIAGDKIKPSDTYTPTLYFVGAMLNPETGADTVPFQYAMNGSSKLTPDNWGSYWITCHSGWPTNLEVKYNDGKAQLVGYPRRDQIDGGWVDDLPYVTAGTDKADEYKQMVTNVTGSGPTTPDEQAFLSAIQNVAIPASVASIRPGLFSGVNAEGKEVNKDGEVVADGAGIGSDENLLSILINGVDELETYTFKDCIGLKSADIIGSSMIDDYAFEDCTGLEQVALGSKLQDTGKRPFKGCDQLMGINCVEPSQFRYNNGILYRNTSSGWEIVECLENRGAVGGTGSYNVGTDDEFNGVSAIKPEAFADCEQIAQVDLSKTTIDIISDGSFKGMNMNSITLPTTLKRINTDAFKGGQAKRFVVYYKGDPIAIEEDAFEPEDPDNSIVIFQCLKNSNADYYAVDYKYIVSSDDEVKQEFTVYIYNVPEWPDMDRNKMVLLDKQQVMAGEDAVLPEEIPTCNNPELAFTGWSEHRNINRDTDIIAMYGTPEFTVTFIDGYTGDILKTEKVKLGGTATPPADDEIPEHPGQIFMGWDKPHYNITADTTIVGRYVDGSGDINRFTVSFYLTDTDTEPWWTTHASDGEVVMAPMPPARPGYTFVRWLWAPASSSTGVKQDTSVYGQWTTGGSGNASPNPSGGNNGGNNGGNTGSPSPGGGNGNNGGSSPSASPTSRTSASPSATPTATPSNGNDVVKYTVSVSGGSGSGSYPAGAVVAINAYFMGEGQVFDKWTSSTAGVGFANPNASSTTFTMPASNVSVTATYKTGGAGTAATNASGGSSGGGSATAGTATNSNGTTVDVTRPGISNTNLAGATVSGATDNFVVKVTEDQSATSAATAALQARFGDLSRIKYFPMDISLYDSTGRTKIADTSGISVNLTLPLPDELVQYAGNNRIAAIAGGALEDLNARFTTIDGVPCINFTATHFSPYVIYVDTANLTEATIDATPKTGDPIHPKWFLALGMACMSLILFFKRDKVVINTKTA